MSLTKALIAVPTKYPPFAETHCVSAGVGVADRCCYVTVVYPCYTVTVVSKIACFTRTFPSVLMARQTVGSVTQTLVFAIVSISPFWTFCINKKSTKILYIRIFNTYKSLIY
jgi:hypothetical protein